MYKATQTRIQTYLNDVAGVRIVCAFIDDNRLDEQIRQAVLSLETKWTEKEIGFQVELEEVKYTANEGLFMHVWINLLDNAIKFSPSKGTITMFLKQEQDSVKFLSLIHILAVTAESSISAKRAATCFPLSFTREKIVPIVFLSARRTRILDVYKRQPPDS